MVLELGDGHGPLAHDLAKVDIGQPACGEDREVPIRVVLIVEIGLSVERVDVSVPHVSHRDRIAHIGSGKCDGVAYVAIAIEEQDIELGVANSAFDLGFAERVLAQVDGEPLARDLGHDIVGINTVRRGYGAGCQDQNRADGDAR
jgi:hypothetical protein